MIKTLKITALNVKVMVMGMQSMTDDGNGDKDNVALVRLVNSM